MTNYYSKPVYGRAYKMFSTDMVELNSSNVDQWSFKKIVSWKHRSFATYQNDKGEEIMQSLQAIRYVRLRPGELNYMSKLTDAQGLEIFRRANEGESKQVLSKEFGVSERYIDDIKNIRTRIGITLNYINGVEKAKPTQATVAVRSKGKKLSPALAKFIRSDRINLKLTTKQLAKKYCVSERTIQRILKGEMYP